MRGDMSKQFRDKWSKYRVNASVGTVQNRLIEKKKTFSKTIT